MRIGAWHSPAASLWSTRTWIKRMFTENGLETITPIGRANRAIARNFSMSMRPRMEKVKLIQLRPPDWLDIAGNIEWGRAPRSDPVLPVAWEINHEYESV